MRYYTAHLASQEPESSVKQTIVESLEAPRLSNIDTEHFVKFLQLREIYENKVTEKRKEIGPEVPMTSYRTSIDKSVLELMVMAQWISANNVNGITEDQLRKCVRKKAVI